MTGVRPAGTAGSRTDESRSKKSARGSDFPHARLAIQVVRRRPPIGSTTWSSETVDAISNLPWRQCRVVLIDFNRTAVMFLGRCVH